MIKNFIAPIQVWLLSQGFCVGCGAPLTQAKSSTKNGKEIVTCKCGRMYVHDPETDQYRRALFDEI